MYQVAHLEGPPRPAPLIGLCPLFSFLDTIAQVYDSGGFCPTMTKCMARNTLKKRRFILAHSLERYSRFWSGKHGSRAGREVQGCMSMRLIISIDADQEA